MYLSTQTTNLLTRISGKFIYGAIILGAVIGSLSDPLPGNLRVILIVFLSLQAISLANGYARTIEADMADKRVTPWRDKWMMLLRPGWIMSSTVVPIVFFTLAFLGLISQATALAATKTLLLILLLFFGFVSRRLSGAGHLQSILAGLVVALLGYIVVQIKLWTKYLPAMGY